MTKEHIYYVKGIHCASCEVLIEKELLEFENIKSVEVSQNETVTIEYENEYPSIERLNQKFKGNNYVFSNTPILKKEKFNYKEFFSSFLIALVFIVLFIILERSGLSGMVNVNSKSSLLTFLVFGVIAGFSCCAALVGGIVLSMSKQWAGHKTLPHLMFNLGRMIFFFGFGAILGLIGNKLQLSLFGSSILVLMVSLIMIFMGLQMIGLRAFRKFQIKTPKFLTRYVANENNFRGRYMPFILGGLTFFLPCGFTATVQGMALLSGSVLQGGLIMLFFVIGTIPMLFLIGLTSSKLANSHLSKKFLIIAGILVLFFALHNINAQLNVLGIKNLSFLNVDNKMQQVNGGIVPMVNGRQLIKMEASATGYKPNYFKVKVNVPVQWEITDTGTSGCTNAVVSKNLFDGAINLTVGQTSIKEFTPTRVGKYKFSCWMGMITGTIEVVQ